MLSILSERQTPGLAPLFRLQLPLQGLSLLVYSISLCFPLSALAQTDASEAICHLFVVCDLSARRYKRPDPRPHVSWDRR
jgi:hypothetical protein